MVMIIRSKISVFRFSSAFSIISRPSGCVSIYLGFIFGKRLDFLAQEINREANTAASKALFVEMTQAAVLIKDALENFREQARNIE